MMLSAARPDGVYWPGKAHEFKLFHHALRFSADINVQVLAVKIQRRIIRLANPYLIRVIVRH